MAKGLVSSLDQVVFGRIRYIQDGVCDLSIDHNDNKYRVATIVITAN